MATKIYENIISMPSRKNPVIFTLPESATSSETFTFDLNDSADDIYLIADASNSAPGNHILSLIKGDFETAKTPLPVTVSDGEVVFIPIESGIVQKKDGSAMLTLATTISGGLANTGIKLAIVKRRFVINN